MRIFEGEINIRTPTDIVTTLFRRCYRLPSLTFDIKTCSVSHEGVLRILLRSQKGATGSLKALFYSLV